MLNSNKSDIDQSQDFDAYKNLKIDHYYGNNFNKMECEDYENVDHYSAMVTDDTDEEDGDGYFNPLVYCRITMDDNADSSCVDTNISKTLNKILSCRNNEITITRIPSNKEKVETEDYSDNLKNHSNRDILFNFSNNKINYDVFGNCSTAKKKISVKSNNDRKKNVSFNLDDDNTDFSKNRIKNQTYPKKVDLNGSGQLGVSRDENSGHISDYLEIMMNSDSDNELEELNNNNDEKKLLEINNNIDNNKNQSISKNYDRNFTEIINRTIDGIYNDQHGHKKFKSNNHKEKCSIEFNDNGKAEFINHTIRNVAENGNKNFNNNPVFHADHNHATIIKNNRIPDIRPINPHNLAVIYKLIDKNLISNKLGNIYSIKTHNKSEISENLDIVTNNKVHDNGISSNKSQIESISNDYKMYTCSKVPVINSLNNIVCQNYVANNNLAVLKKISNRSENVREDVKSISNDSKSVGHDEHVLKPLNSASVPLTTNNNGVDQVIDLSINKDVTGSNSIPIGNHSNEIPEDNGNLINNDNKKRKKKYTCEYCNKIFGWSTDLKRHTLIHTGERPFKCDSCSAAFTRKFLLQKHKLKLHHCLTPQEISDLNKSVAENILEIKAKMQLLEANRKVQN